VNSNPLTSNGRSSIAVVPSAIVDVPRIPKTADSMPLAGTLIWAVYVPRHGQRRAGLGVAWNGRGEGDQAAFLREHGQRQQQREEGGEGDGGGMCAHEGLR
jgi:hypothetical protein